MQITDAQTAKDIEKLVSCADLVFREIACDYIPLRKTALKKSSGGMILFKDFSEKIVDVYSVKLRGAASPFKTFYDGIKVEADGEFLIEYSYLPPKAGLETELPWKGGRPDERIAGYGIACEYCLISGMVDEAVLWDKRFKDGLFKADTVKKEIRVKRRPWL